LNNALFKTPCDQQREPAAEATSDADVAAMTQSQSVGADHAVSLDKRAVDAAVVKAADTSTSHEVLL